MIPSHVLVAQRIRMDLGELLRQVALDLPGVRPPVIRPEIAKDLDEFRRFRHLVRNLYAEYLEPERIGQLVEQLTSLWPRLQADLVRFADFLEGVSRADDTLP